MNMTYLQLIEKEKTGILKELDTLFPAISLTDTPQVAESLESIYKNTYTLFYVNILYIYSERNALTMIVIYLLIMASFSYPLEFQKILEISEL